MRGFGLASIGLIALYVALQKGSSDRLASSSDAISRIISRITSPEAAGVPQRGYHTALNPQSSGGGGGPPKATDAPLLPTGGGTVFV